MAIRNRAATALLALSLLTSGPSGARSPKPTMPQENSPVRCWAGEPVPMSHRTSGPMVKMRGTSIHSSPSPLPSAPPPPVLSSPMIAQGQVVSDTKGRAVMYPQPMPYPAPESRERYDGKPVSAIKSVASDPVSTFSVDVDTGAYANVRRYLTQGQTPPTEAVRTEEMLNYFRYDYVTPQDRTRPFAVSTDMALTPWNPDSRLLRIGIKGFDLAKQERPAANLVFLVDVSGSMYSQDKLPLVKTALSMLADRISPKDRVSIVVYAGAAGIVLEPTNQASHIRAALDCLQAGGSTAGGQGMELAYSTARAHFIKGGVNRVIMATDGDFNVGISSNEGIEAIVKKNRESGITLTTLGFGQGNYNEAMMEKIADIGNGNYAYIDSAIEAQKVLDDEVSATLFTIAKDVKIQLEFNPAVVKEYRLIGYENRILAEQDFNNDKVDAGDIGAGHQVTALYEIIPVGGRGWLSDRRYEANRPVARTPYPARELGWLKLRYKLPEGEKSLLIEQAVPEAAMATAQAASGDMAFAAAVAAFGQKLRRDSHLGGYSYADIRRLAGGQRGYLREEFIKLTSLAESRQVAGRD
jgi:Ca-activated chloride channel homolog